MINMLALLGAWLLGTLGASPFAHGAGTFPAGAAVTASPTVAAAQIAFVGEDADAALLQAPPVRLWLAEDSDFYYPGDPVQVLFRTASDAYVAVVHLDADGNLDLLFPVGASDSFVRGQRTYSLSDWGGGRFALGRTRGIGYFYIVASREPLDLRSFRTRGGRWGSERVVRGDPFWALEQLTLELVRNPRFTPFAVDFLSYHVGGRHRFPAFACYNNVRGVDVRGASAYYPSCDRLQRLLVTYPYYYDARRYRGDRTVYLRELEALAPRHDFKEPLGGAAPPVRQPDPWPGVRRAEPRRPDDRGPPPATVERDEPQQQAPAPVRTRPSLERRDPPRDSERQRPPPREPEPERERPRANPAPREQPPREAPPPRQDGERGREGVRPEPRRPPDVSRDNADHVSAGYRLSLARSTAR